MSRRGWIFLGVGVAVAVLAVCCVAVVAVLALGGSGLAPSLALGGGAPKYEVVNEGRTESADRLRWQVEIVFQEDPSAKQWVDTTADIIRDRLKTKPELKAVVVLAYTSNGQFKLRQPKVLAM